MNARRRGKRIAVTTTLESCQEFCAKVALSLPTDAQLEHAWDRLAIPEEASNLKPVWEVSFVVAGRSEVQRNVFAGFHPVFNLGGPERRGDQKNRVRDYHAPRRTLIGPRKDG